MTQLEMNASQSMPQPIGPAEVGEPVKEPVSQVQATATRFEPTITVGLTRGVVHEVPARTVYKGGTVG